MKEDSSIYGSAITQNFVQQKLSFVHTVSSPEKCSCWLSVKGFSKYYQLPTFINSLIITTQEICSEFLLGDVMERDKLETRFFATREGHKFVV